MGNSMSVSTHKTFCRFCHAYCAIEVDVKDGKPIKVRGDTDDPVYGGYTCLKGRELPEQYTTPARVSKSLKSNPDGDFEEIDTDQAMDEIAAKIQQLIKMSLQRQHELGEANAYLATVIAQHTVTVF